MQTLENCDFEAWKRLSPAERNYSIYCALQRVDDVAQRLSLLEKRIVLYGGALSIIVAVLFGAPSLLV